jgi:hypothetical protein
VLNDNCLQGYGQRNREILTRLTDLEKYHNIYIGMSREFLDHIESKLALVFFSIYETLYTIYEMLLVHCLDHILVALHEDTFFDLEGGSEGAILNVEFLSDD